MGFHFEASATASLGFEDINDISSALAILQDDYHMNGQEAKQKVKVILQEVFGEKVSRVKTNRPLKFFLKAVYDVRGEWINNKFMDSKEFQCGDWRGLQLIKRGDVVSVSRNHRFLNQLPIPDYYRHVFVALRRKDPGSSPSSIDGVELFLENGVARVVRNNIINILRREGDEEDWLKLVTATTVEYRNLGL